MKFENLGCEKLYDGFFRMNRYTLRNEKFEGGWNGPFTREIFERGHAVAVLPYDPVHEKIVLIEQFRFPAHLAKFDPWLLEVVAGIIEDGEQPDDVVRREMTEEAGCDIQHLEYIQRILVSPGGTTESVRLYCAQIDSTKIDGIHGQDDEHEDIKPHVFDVSDVMDMMHAGKISNASTLMCLQWFALNHERLKKQWSM